MPTIRTMTGGCVCTHELLKPRQVRTVRIGRSTGLLDLEWCLDRKIAQEAQVWVSSPWMDR